MTVVADVRGSGPPVVLLHGQPGNAIDWAPVAALLTPRHTVVTPDRPGYGRTGGSALGFVANADVVVALLDDLGVGRAVVAGHSWGAGVAIALAERHPGRLLGVALVAPVVPIDPPGRLDRVLALPVVGAALAAVGLGAAGQALTWPAVRRMVRRSLGGASDDELLRVAESWRRRESWRSFVVEQRALVDELPRLAPGLFGIGVPVTVLVGSADRIVPPSGGERLAGVIPGAELVRLDGAGHLLVHERPQEIAAAIADLASAGTG